MKCTKCGKEIGTKETPAYQVQMGYVDKDYPEDDKVFIPDEDIGYYCNECLASGIK